MNELEKQINIVVETRERAKEAKGIWDAVRTEWEDQNRGLLDEVGRSSAELNVAEIELRELTLEAYAQTGSKNPAPGVGIREITKLDYDAKVALDWAIHHEMALKLDTSAFEKIVKASPPTFVSVSQEPQATIATQLEPIKEGKDG